jgi:FkbM family methyltransferase
LKNNSLIYGKSFHLIANYIIKPVIICGYGQNARLLMGLLSVQDTIIYAVCDKNHIGEPYDYSVPGQIKNYDILKELNEDFLVVIPSITYFDNIRENILDINKNLDILNINIIKNIFNEIPKCFQLDTPDYFKKYIKLHEKEFKLLNDALLDVHSQKTLAAFINMRLSWNEDYAKEAYRSDMYFIKELYLSSNESFIDVGAYNGDSLVAFLKKVNYRCKKAICIEPNNNNFNAIHKVISDYPNLDIELIETAVSNKIGFLGFTGSDTNFHSCEKSDLYIKAITIDSLQIAPTFIKMDIQGEEYNALMGAVNTINKYRPSLAICVYHKTRDLLDIFTLLRKLNPEYRFYLRHHACDINDTVLYAV